MKVMTPLKAIRANCLECSAGSAKHITYCPNDGVHSGRCHLWPYRHGCRPETVADQTLVTPGALPGPDVSLDDLPMLKVARKGTGRRQTPEERQRLAEQLKRGRERRAAGVD